MPLPVWPSTSNFGRFGQPKSLLPVQKILPVYISLIFTITRLHILSHSPTVTRLPFFVNRHQGGSGQFIEPLQHASGQTWSWCRFGDTVGTRKFQRYLDRCLPGHQGFEGTTALLTPATENALHRRQGSGMLLFPVPYPFSLYPRVILRPAACSNLNGSSQM